MPVVPLFAAVLALLYVALSFNVIRFRRRTLTSLGCEEGNKEMEKAIRTHANFAEYVPIALILLFILEFVIFAPSFFVFVLCSCLLIGRISHLIGLKSVKKYVRFRQLGMVLTFFPIIVSSLRVVWYYLPL